MTIWIADEESYHFVFLPEFILNHTNNTVTVNLHHELSRMFLNRMVTRLDTAFRDTLGREVSKRLYAFFQRSWRPGKRYSIALPKLCRYIGFQTEGKPPWYSKEKIGQGLKELENKGYLKKAVIEGKTVVRVVLHSASHSEITEEALEEIRLRQKAAKYQRQEKKNFAHYRKLEEGVPPGQCPHGFEFGDINPYREACNFCGQEFECEDKYNELVDERQNQPVSEKPSPSDAPAMRYSLAAGIDDDDDLELEDVDDGTVTLVQAFKELGLAEECPHGYIFALDHGKMPECSECPERKKCKNALWDATINIDWLSSLIRGET